MDWRQILKTRLRQRKITLATVADATNVTVGAVSHWLTGRNEPPIGAIRIMASLAGVAMNELFGDESQYLVVDQDEIRLVELLRQIPEPDREAALRMLSGLAKPTENPPEQPA